MPTSGLRYAPVSEGGGPIQWEGGEHTYIGNVITLKLITGEVLAGKVKLPLPNGLELTYGQILALGGDFYGLPKTPISEDQKPPALFEQAFATLASAPAAVAEAPQILAVMQEEIEAVNNAVRAGEPASSAYRKLGDSLSEKWNRITGGGSSVSAWLPMGRYLELAATNWDHFCPWAWSVYSMGHGAAIQQATAARKEPDPARQAHGLALAYAMNAFADHYLSDMFSAGHMRTPRKQLYDEVFPAAVGSYCSRYMHDEDSNYGLAVGNKAGEHWTAYGDKRFFDSPNADNKRICVQTIQASANDVWSAFEGKAPAEPTAAQYVPDFAALTNNPSDPANPAAMFIASGSKVERRTDLSNRQGYKWTSFWFGLPTLAQLKLLPEFAGDDIGPFDLSSNLLALGKGADGVFGLNLIGPGPKGFETLWSSGSTAFPLAATDVFSTGDLDADGAVELVQLSLTGTVTVFAPVPNSYGYQPLPQSTLEPSFAGTPNNLLIGDVNGDGADEVCVPYTTPSGKMGLIVAVLKSGALQVISGQELPAPCSYASIGIGDLDGSGRDAIVTLWNDPSNQVYAGVYRWDDESKSMALTTTGPLGQWSPRQSELLCGDINGDGRAEFLRCTDADTQGTGEGSVEIYAGDGKGGLSRTSETAMKADIWWLADLDGDGKSELLALYAAASMSPGGAIWADNGQGGLQRGWATSELYPIPPRLTASIDLGANFGAQYAYALEVERGALTSLVLFGWGPNGLAPLGRWPLGPIATPFNLFAMPVQRGVGPDFAGAVAGEGE